MKKQWYDYLWIASLMYLALGFFNIFFAWLGLLCFFIPLGIALIKGTKGYCNRYCGRGQLFGLLGGRFGLSRKKDIPRWMKSREKKKQEKKDENWKKATKKRMKDNNKYR